MTDEKLEQKVESESDKPKVKKQHSWSASDYYRFFQRILEDLKTPDNYKLARVQRTNLRVIMKHSVLTSTELGYKHQGKEKKLVHYSINRDAKSIEDVVMPSSFVIEPWNGYKPRGKSSQEECTRFLQALFDTDDDLIKITETIDYIFGRKGYKLHINIDPYLKSRPGREIQHSCRMSFRANDKESSVGSSISFYPKKGEIKPSIFGRILNGLARAYYHVYG
jgi:hypothetical protein